MTKTGIWMDKEKAHIVRLDQNGETFETLYSEMEFFNIKGGSRTTNTKCAPQDIVRDSKYLEREKHQMREYFQKMTDNQVKALVRDFFRKK